MMQESDCSKLMENYWTLIEVDANMCSEMVDELVFAYNPCLEGITVKTGALKNIQQFSLMQLPELVSFECEASAFYNATRVEFTSK